VEGVGNVVAHNVGLGDSTGTFTLHEYPTNLGRSTITGRSVGRPDEIEIRVERLDDLTLDLSSLCFVKIDVEGFEPSVIRGAVEVIGAHEPLIVLEQHDVRVRRRHDAVDRSPADLGLSLLLAPRRHAGPLKILAPSRQSARAAHRANAPDPDRHARAREDHSMLIAVPPRFAALLAPT
jgi:hypothetical protein